jgi:hypothetical protein
MLSYVDSVAAFAAAKVQEPKPSAGELRRRSLTANRVAGAIAAKGSFPNALGNYKGKRKAKPNTPAFTPEQRFAKLNQQYNDFRRNRRAGV